MSQDQMKCDTAYERFKCSKPLDFSYRNLKSLEELNGNENHSPLRVRGVPNKCPRSNRYKTGSFWLNHNCLKNVNGLKSLADRLFEMADYLSWVDLSNNNITTISDEFLLFPNMSMLYLHWNHIEDVAEVYKLSKLRKLRTLTLNNNPMCAAANYRSTVVYLVPGLRKLDNVVVGHSERVPNNPPIAKDVLARLSREHPEDFPAAKAAPAKR